MDWSKAKQPEVPVIVKTAWCRLTASSPPKPPSECWVTYHPDFPANGGDGIYNAWPKTDFYGKEMPECRVHAEAECVNLNAEREAWLKSPRPEPPPSPFQLKARHCRSCGCVTFGLSSFGAHKKPDTDEDCKDWDFGPEVVVAVVPW